MWLSIKPISPKAHLTGIGLDSTNSILFMTPAGDGTLGGNWVYAFGLHLDITGTEAGDDATFGWTGPDGSHQMIVTKTEEGYTGLHQMQGEDGTWQDIDTVTYTRVVE